MEYSILDHIHGLVGNEGFEKIKIRDAIKNKYCEDNRIKLIRIPYTEFKNIEIILSQELKFNGE